MRKGLILLVVALLPLGVLAQEASVDSWNTTVTGTLGLNQASYSNWSEGGVNSVSFAANLVGGAKKEDALWRRSHDFQFSYGQTKQDEADFQKTTDLIKYIYNLERITDFWLHPTFNFEFRTQFAPGFDFSTTPEQQTSEFFAPAYFSQLLGGSFEIQPWWIGTIGLAAKETVVNAPNLRPLYGLATDESMRWEGGLSLLLKVDKPLAENIVYKSSLNTFTGFAAFFETVDVRWENLIQMKVNDWMNVNFELTLFYDEDIIDEVQRKQVLSLGFSYKFM